MTISTSERSPAERAEIVRARALELGFDVAGFCDADAPPLQTERLARFLADGRHGDMEWMAARSRERAAPRNLWPEARSVVMLGLNYGPREDPLAVLAKRDCGAVSVYARGRDYHDVVKKKLKALARFIVETLGGEVKVFVDTAPVMEKPLGARAGLGWQGKHTNLVSKKRGSWLFLGAVFSTLEFAADAPEPDHCGTCRACLDICPTRAFPAPYQLDARRCISYLTIEHKGPIPREFRTAIGNRIYGCDDCLAACPWNKFAAQARETALHARETLNAPKLEALARLDDAAFRAFFSGSPVKRTGRDRFLRNVMIAIGNSGLVRLADVAEARLDDASPLVRGAAVWALSRLLSAAEFEAQRARRAGDETDEDVRREWEAGRKPASSCAPR
ncbi:MAG: tRNA epoxyqueuosine(34) reductase QueG [Alphaproteobacteria bacterium]|nr:tRNA epoxyqueuosine(34) reductase QueG [Alphaproteobacteria bacterium]